MARCGWITLFLAQSRRRFEPFTAQFPFFDPFDFAQDKFLDLRPSID
jgi:hypothetical protein